MSASVMKWGCSRACAAPAGRRGAVEGVISLAFGRDDATTEAVGASIAEEGATLAAQGEELVGSDRPIVAVSGTPRMPGRASTEADPLPVEGPVVGRALSVMALLDLADRGLRSSAVRMPRTVHDHGTGGFAGLLTDMARAAGVSGYPGDGTQRWPAVHARDAAVRFRIVLESAPARTARHAVAYGGDAVRDMPLSSAGGWGCPWSHGRWRTSARSGR